MCKKDKYIKKIKGYFRRTYKNKVCALIILILGLLSTLICEDGTAFVFLTVFFALPLFLSKENCIK